MGVVMAWHWCGLWQAKVCCGGGVRMVRERHGCAETGTLVRRSGGRGWVGASGTSVGGYQKLSEPIGIYRRKSDIFRQVLIDSDKFRSTPMGKY